MKKLFLTLCLCVMAVCASAQKFTVWYGMNLASVDVAGYSPDSKMKFLNVGLEYAAPFADTFDWGAGVSYMTKGFDGWDPGFIQLDANARWNFVQSDDYKVGLLAGPYLGFMVLDDDAEGTNAVDFGIGIGAMGTYRDFSLKLGYEFGLTNSIENIDSKLRGFYIRLGYSF